MPFQIHLFKDLKEAVPSSVFIFFVILKVTSFFLVLKEIKETFGRIKLLAFSELKEKMAKFSRKESCQLNTKYCRATVD